MINIDNSIELAMKKYLALNKQSLSMTYKRFKDSLQRFPVMLNIIQEFIPDKMKK